MRDEDYNKFVSFDKINLFEFLFTNLIITFMIKIFFGVIY